MSCSEPQQRQKTSIEAIQKKSAATILATLKMLEQVKGVEPSSSAWKADVLAVVRHLHGNEYYNRAGAPLSRGNRQVFLSKRQENARGFSYMAFPI